MSYMCRDVNTPVITWWGASPVHVTKDLISVRISSHVYHNKVRINISTSLVSLSPLWCWDPIYTLKVIYHPLYSMNNFVPNKSKVPQDGSQVFPYMG